HAQHGELPAVAAVAGGRRTPGRHLLLRAVRIRAHMVMEVEDTRSRLLLAEIRAHLSAASAGAPARCARLLPNSGLACRMVDQALRLDGTAPERACDTRVVAGSDDPLLRQSSCVDAHG